jgi:hypothetical protein
LPETLSGPPFYTAQLYLRLLEALDGGTAPAPDFADAAKTHRLLAAVQTASDTGIRQRL